MLTTEKVTSILAHNLPENLICKKLKGNSFEVSSNLLYDKKGKKISEDYIITVYKGRFAVKNKVTGEIISS